MFIRERFPSPSQYDVPMNDEKSYSRNVFVRLYM